MFSAAIADSVILACAIFRLPQKPAPAPTPDHRDRRDARHDAGAVKHNDARHVARHRRRLAGLRRRRQRVLSASPDRLAARGNPYTVADGTVVVAGVPDRLAMSLDLSADQCTMLIFYRASPRALGRFDICSGTPLKDVPIDPAIFDKGYPRFRLATQGGDRGVAIYLFDLATGLVVAGPYAGFNIIQALSVAGEPRAALPSFGNPRSRPSRCCSSR
jgi:hypothetical protein